MLGDNTFHGVGLGTSLRTHTEIDGAVVFAYHVSNPSAYGVIEDRRAFKIGCIEEFAWRNGWIDDTRLVDLAGPLVKSGYGEHLKELVS